MHFFCKRILSSRPPFPKTVVVLTMYYPEVNLLIRGKAFVNQTDADGLLGVKKKGED